MNLKEVINKIEIVENNLRGIKDALEEKIRQQYNIEEGKRIKK